MILVIAPTKMKITYSWSLFQYFAEYEEAEKYCDWIQEMGEDVVWTPFEVYEYLI